MIGTIIVGHFVARYETGHTLKEWKSKFGKNTGLWDFPVDEILDGTIEPNGEFLYWLIDGRLYETEFDYA